MKNKRDDLEERFDYGSSCKRKLEAIAKVASFHTYLKVFETTFEIS